MLKPRFRIERHDIDYDRQHIKDFSWNYIGHDPREFRHYGPMAQDFYGAFGHDEVGTIGTPTTYSGDIAGILMIAAQALEKRTAEQRQEVETLKAENASLKARLEALEKNMAMGQGVEQR
jgi:hypothetical protein